MRWYHLPLFLLLVLPQLVEAAPAKARPLAGTGLLRLPVQTLAPAEIVLYREPGVGRIQVAGIADLPVLKQSPSAESYCYLPVIARKRGWLKIIYDDSEHDAWIERRNGWLFLSWDEFLTGARVNMARGLRKEFYQPRREPLPSAELLESVEKRQPLAVLQVEGDWIRIAAGENMGGWLRWRDDNGRLLVLPLAEDVR
jgi:hypothetical protein